LNAKGKKIANYAPKPLLQEIFPFSGRTQDIFNNFFIALRVYINIFEVYKCKINTKCETGGAVLRGTG